MLQVLAHGGAGSYDHKEHDGPQAAADAGLEILRGGGSVLEAAIAATKVLEDDTRFNAGTGSNLRMDGKTIEMDAAVMTDDGRFGGVACIDRVKNPVAVAAEVWATPHNLLAGSGATAYARKRGHKDHDPLTPMAQGKFDKLQAMVKAANIEPGWCEWDIQELEKHWNYETPLRQVMGPSDTVGAVASDGQNFAAALSTGGTIATLLGRVGDVPLPGCGIHAGPAGAVAVTGDGDHLARAMLASRMYDEIASGMDANLCVDKWCNSFAEDVAVGAIVVTAEDHAGGSNLQMAWAVAQSS